MHRTILCLPALVPLVAFPVASRAQVFHGIVLDRELNKPVLVAAVTLVDYTNKVRAASITDSAGRFEIAAPNPGRYKIRVDPRGYHTMYSGEYIADVGDTIEVNMLVSASADLPEVTTIRRRTLAPGCVPPRGEGAETTPDECGGTWAVEVYNCFDQSINVYYNSEGETLSVGELSPWQYAVFHPATPSAARPSVSVHPQSTTIGFVDRSRGLITTRLYCDPNVHQPGRD